MSCRARASLSYPACQPGKLRRFLAPALVLVFAVLLPLSAFAEEVQWRHDYNAARKEAEQKNRPLVIDFYMHPCFFCDKLDASTFRDPTVVRLMNERFIPLKIDKEQEAALAQSLHIENYPTLILAAADGKILDTMVGYRDAAQLLQALKRALPAPPAADPDWMVRDYREATKAIAASDYGRAITLLRGILEDNKNRPVQVKAAQVLQDLEKQAAERLARSKQMNDKGRTTDTVQALTQLLKAFPGTQAASEAGQMLSAIASKPEVKINQRDKRARELLSQAREDFRTQQYLCCLDRCEVLASSYGDLPEGVEAMQLAADIKNNPEWMRLACENLSDRLGLLYLAMAETWIRKGQPQEAATYLEKVIQQFPGTRQAEAAQMKLAYIRGQSTLQAEFKKP
jgi:thioredoxin-related protein